MKKQPLTFRQFIKCLHTMEVYIPLLGNPGDVIILFQRGGGYNPAPTGPSCAFISREADELVPLAEIKDTLSLLEVDHGVFWKIEDHSTDEHPETATNASAITSESPSAIAKQKDPK